MSELTDDPPTSGNAVLSRRSHPFVGWVAIDEFEDLYAELSGARLLVPTPRAHLPGLVGRARNRLIGDVAVPDDAASGDLLLVVARSPRDLQAVRGVKRLRQRFRHVAGYVIDSYFYAGYSAATRLYDHVFTTTREGAEHVRKTYGVPSSVIAQGFDCLNWSSAEGDRCIDLLGFGRQPPSYHHEFQRAFHGKASPLLYLHSPIGTSHGPDVWTERAMMLKLMQRSKLALAFHLLVEPQGNRPKAMFVTSRWFESLATGCVVVGRRPVTDEAVALFDWPDATIELPESALESVRVVAELSARDEFLAATRLRNVTEMCRRHDWRYRIRDILGHFELPVPNRLSQEIDALADRVRTLSARSVTTAEAL